MMSQCNIAILCILRMSNMAVSTLLRLALRISFWISSTCDATGPRRESCGHQSIPDTVGTSFVSIRREIPLNLADFVLHDDFGYGAPLRNTGTYHMSGGKQPICSHGFFLLILHGLIAAGDIELNPGPYGPRHEYHNYQDRPGNHKNITCLLCNA